MTNHNTPEPEPLKKGLYPAREEAPSEAPPRADANVVRQHPREGEQTRSDENQ